MLLKISLGIAILAGLATLYFSHFDVAQRITTITTEKEEASKQRDEANRAKAEADKKQKAAETALATTKKDLEAKDTAYKGEVAKRTEQEKRANKLAEELTKTTEERNEAQRGMAAFNALGMTIEQIRALRDDLRKVGEQRDAFVAENKILARNNAQLKKDIRDLIGTENEPEPKLPPGLKGKVIAVDPKFDFIVIDIGGNQGVVENGRLLVNRNGRLVAKVKVTAVEPTRSVANVLPEWKQDEIMEGDQVLY